MLNEKQLFRLSKFLSLVLRHKPHLLGIKLDANGWVSIEDLLKANAAHDTHVIMTLDSIKQAVATNNKKRFAISPDGLMIRASQGHSVPIELNLGDVEPPTILYHGTVDLYMDSIKTSGLKRGHRNHVHLSADIETANKVGRRRGKPVILEIKAKWMHNDGHKFFLSDNGVWLTDHVPTKYLRL